MSEIKESVLKPSSVSDQTSNLENRNWIDTGSSPVAAKHVCENCELLNNSFLLHSSNLKIKQKLNL